MGEPVQCGSEVRPSLVIRSVPMLVSESVPVEVCELVSRVVLRPEVIGPDHPLSPLPGLLDMGSDHGCGSTPAPLGF